MGAKSRKTTPALGSEAPAAEFSELPERRSAQRKSGLVLRGEALDALCRESRGATSRAGDLDTHVHRVRARGLRIHGKPEARELTLVRAKIGELMMKLELAEHLIEKGGSRTSGRGTSDEGCREPEHGPPLSRHDDLCCAVLRVARSSVYATGTSARSADRPPRKRGPKTTTADGELVAAIRHVLPTTLFHGEGYPKVRARLGPVQGFRPRDGVVRLPAYLRHREQSAHAEDAHTDERAAAPRRHGHDRGHGAASDPSSWQPPEALADFRELGAPPRPRPSARTSSRGSFVIAIHLPP